VENNTLQILGLIAKNQKPKTKTHFVKKQHWVLVIFLSSFIDLMLQKIAFVS
jgi:hypothetical protein